MRNAQNSRHLAKTKFECNEELRTIICQVTVVSNHIVSTVCFCKISSHEARRVILFSRNVLTLYIRSEAGEEQRYASGKIKCSLSYGWVWWDCECYINSSIHWVGKTFWKIKMYRKEITWTLRQMRQSHNKFHCIPLFKMFGSVGRRGINPQSS